jgi:aminoglycoside phosphotransferase (APT) family kinase protein
MPVTVDAKPLIAEINDRTGSDLELVGVAEHGETGGAVYVRWPNGRDGVVTRTDTPIDQLRRTAEVLSLGRSRGLPLPRHRLLVELDSGNVAVVQERLRGMPARRTDAKVIDAMVALNERFADLLADRPDVPIPPMHLSQSGPAYWRHETLEAYDDRSRDLLGLIREVGGGEPHEMVGHDLVHPDYTLGNVLYDETGRITGVVDWNLGAARGDCRFALVGLRFDLAWSTLYDGGEHGVTQEAIDRLDEILDETIEPTLLRAYWAHWTLNRLDWVISHHSRETIDLFIALGESRLA